VVAAWAVGRGRRRPRGFGVTPKAGRAVREPTQLTPRRAAGAADASAARRAEAEARGAEIPTPPAGTDGLGGVDKRGESPAPSPSPTDRPESRPATARRAGESFLAARNASVQDARAAAATAGVLPPIPSPPMAGGMASRSKRFATWTGSSLPSPSRWRSTAAATATTAAASRALASSGKERSQ